jgi:16S rRNA (guanine966-N2)-methyltransferase
VEFGASRYSGRVRVIGGELRGRRLVAPAGTQVRPTSDRVREAVFDILFSLGGVDGLQVADLFAGSGALGIEALSRGASSVTFVDHSPEALAAVRGNLASVGLGDAEREGEATVIRADVDPWVATTAARYDLILCDPPYDYQGWETLVARLPADLAVLESGTEITAPSGWGVIKTKRYGSTIVTVARPELVTKKGVS